jgi:hypothetical protein
MKYLKGLFFIYVVCLMSGCSLLVNTAIGSDTRTVIIIPKRENISSINKIQINLKDLKLNASDYKEQYDDLNNLLISELKEANLYNTQDSSGDVIKITVRRLNEDLTSKGIQVFVQVFNSKGDIVTSGVYVVIGKGLRQIGYVREQFVDGLVDALKKPALKENMVSPAKVNNKPMPMTSEKNTSGSSSSNQNQASLSQVNNY